MQMTDAQPDPDMILPLQQHPHFMAALALIGRPADVVTLRDGAQRVGQVLMIRRRFLGCATVRLAARGPAWHPDASFPQKVTGLRLLARHGLWMIEGEADDDAALRTAGYRRVVTPAHVAELSLAGTAAERRARLDGKWRNALSQALRAGLRLRHTPFRGENDHWLLQREAEQRRRKGYHTLPMAVTVAFARANPGLVRIFTAEEAGEPVAAMLMLRHGPVATYHIGWSGPRGRATSAHHLILMHAADWLAERGHHRLDLGSVDTESAAGLARFKIGTGAAIRTLAGSWLRIPGLF